MKWHFQEKKIIISSSIHRRRVGDNGVGKLEWLDGDLPKQDNVSPAEIVHWPKVLNESGQRWADMFCPTTGIESCSVVRVGLAPPNVPVFEYQR